MDPDFMIILFMQKEICIGTVNKYDNFNVTEPIVKDSVKQI